MPETPATPAWTITQQTETTDLGPAGTFVAGVRVTFRTAAGVTGSVFVPADGFTVDEVRRMVAAKAAIHDDVAGLQG